jgi:FkbM family methyltransferase
VNYDFVLDDDGVTDERSRNLGDVLASALRRWHFRGKYRLLKRLVLTSGEREIPLFGSRIKLDLSDDMQRWIYMGIYEPRETRWVRQILKPGAAFVDVGANVGYFTLLAASCVGPAGRVVAVEPSGWAFSRLSKTIRQNRLEQVEAARCGLSDHAGSMSLFIPPSAARNHSPSMVQPDEIGATETVPVRTLSSWLNSSLGTKAVDLLKIDVEGHEPAVLEGGHEWLASGRVKAMLIELNDEALKRAASSAENLHAQILALGFKDVTETPFGLRPLETRLFLSTASPPAAPSASPADPR